MIPITERTNITIIITTAPTTHQVPDTSLTITPMEGTSQNNKGNFTEKPPNVQVTLIGPVNKEQMYKIHKILKNCKQYRDKLHKHLQQGRSQ